VTTPLAELLARRIAADGPLTIAAYMAEALGHPAHGYYITRDPLGATGDFTTAPEISQMFGEMIGAWCAERWQAMGRPDPVLLVELGPGRGTLMADALRVLERVPGLATALRLHLVETSPALRARQRAALGARPAHWHDRLDSVPDGPLLLVANEFFDALPIRQLVRTEAGWAERCVGLAPDGRGLAFVHDGATAPLLVPPALRDAPAGSVVELCPAGAAVAAAIGARLAAAGGAALIIDYGYAGPACGDTLQAVRAHRHADILAEPGLADLTAHVDFAALARAAEGAGCRGHGPVGQGDFLKALGIGLRAEQLRRLATPAQARDIEAALARLTGDDQMGRLFKVLALTDAGASVPAGFPG
jgi:NADH dehydrogenase [ubiquinone] 1 alpha subcomplex assembly factor 7